MAELSLREPCDHKLVGICAVVICDHDHPRLRVEDSCCCPGGRETVLDPSLVLDIDHFEVFTASDGHPAIRGRTLTVADVLAALTKEAD